MAYVITQPCIGVKDGACVSVCPVNAIHPTTQEEDFGAADQLFEEAQNGCFDARAVRLLVHCLRGGRGRLSEIMLARRATGFRPPDNRHGIPMPHAQAG